MDDPVKDTVARAEAHERDVQAQIAAAYALDPLGREEEASRYYDRAWKLGVPEAQLNEFLVGYGSTLRNVGRLAESEDILRRAILERRSVPAAQVFLALTLLSKGDASGALAEAFEAALAAGGDEPSLRRYTRAIRFYQDELRGTQR
jgi:tetratricopeptide (TPR) repeat protein